MGLAISFVSTVPEKVWYHTCPSKGKNCHTTKLLEQNGCCKWYTELTYLSDIEEHLGRKEKNYLVFLLCFFKLLL
jgi:ATP-dependent RNA helicase DDX1